MFGITVQRIWPILVFRRFDAFAPDNIQMVLGFQVALLPLIAERFHGLQITFGLQPAFVQLSLQVILRQDLQHCHRPTPAVFLQRPADAFTIGDGRDRVLLQLS